LTQVFAAKAKMAFDWRFHTHDFIAAYRTTLKIPRRLEVIADDTSSLVVQIRAHR
jgi:hypothetical protein